jgi:hypothetical protein
MVSITQSNIDTKKAEYQSASTDAKNSIVNGVLSDFQSVFDEVYTISESASNDYKTALFYKTRTDDYSKLQNAVSARTANEKDSLTQDRDNARRQSEINEWSAYNKLDTLFISQLIFIGLVFLAPLLYLKSVYIIPGSIFWGIAMMIFLALLFTIVYRVQYTDKSRSNHFWHRRRFGDYSKTPNTVCN